MHPMHPMHPVVQRGHVRGHTPLSDIYYKPRDISLYSCCPVHLKGMPVEVETRTLDEVREILRIIK